MRLNTGYHCDPKLVSTVYILLVIYIYSMKCSGGNTQLNSGYHCDLKLVSTLYIVLVNNINSREILKGEHAA